MDREHHKTFEDRFALGELVMEALEPVNARAHQQAQLIGLLALSLAALAGVTILLTLELRKLES